jgi:hypothetical protein
MQIAHHVVKAKEHLFAQFHWIWSACDRAICPMPELFIREDSQGCSGIEVSLKA